MSVPWMVWVWAVVWAGLIAGVLQWRVRERGHWLIACVISAGAYVVLSLQLERQIGMNYLVGLRWGLFTAALFAFVKYRFARERSAD